MFQMLDVISPVSKRYWICRKAYNTHFQRSTRLIKNNSITLFYQMIICDKMKWMQQNKTTRSRWRQKWFHTEPPHRSNHSARFSDHKSCESGYISFKNFHATSHPSRVVVSYLVSTLVSLMFMVLLQAEI